MNVLAIDPGPEMSAWVYYDPECRAVLRFGIDNSVDLLTPEWINKSVMDSSCDGWDYTAIEMVACYGMPVGREVFETALWVGRYVERSLFEPELIYRREVKLTICKDSRAKDSNIRQGLLNRWGGNGAIGTKKSPGPLYGISKDVWAALGVAVTFSVKHGLEPDTIF